MYEYSNYGTFFRGSVSQLCRTSIPLGPERWEIEVVSQSLVVHLKKTRVPVPVLVLAVDYQSSIACAALDEQHHYHEQHEQLNLYHEFILRLI